MQLELGLGDRSLLHPWLVDTLAGAGTTGRRGGRGALRLGSHLGVVGHLRAEKCQLVFGRAALLGLNSSHAVRHAQLSSERGRLLLGRRRACFSLVPLELGRCPMRLSL
eukprot:scaffold3329_cov120-Isochrysis_galbana.AAC.2